MIRDPNRLTKVEGSKVTIADVGINGRCLRCYTLLCTQTRRVQRLGAEVESPWQLRCEAPGRAETSGTRAFLCSGYSRPPSCVSRCLTQSPQERPSSCGRGRGSLPQTAPLSGQELLRLPGPDTPDPSVPCTAGSAPWDGGRAALSSRAVLHSQLSENLVGVQALQFIPHACFLGSGLVSVF